uniref:copper chaperone PCu(A)C n=1 Tax=Parerythrobacter lutipelagi TaxID=1964208 RepID=UPI0010F4B8A3|nr:copper chaperone PCu(A)C [Parerythrobacter lutipelagi]
MKSIRTFAILGAAASFSLAACSEGPREDYNPEATKKGERLTVENARIMLPAVDGNPAVAFFDLTYASGGGPTVKSVEIDGAGSAEIHATDTIDGKTTMGEAAPITLWPRQTLSFEPGGYHVMVMNPSEDIKAGAETNMTVTLSNEETITVAVPIQAAGEDR